MSSAYTNAWAEVPISAPVEMQGSSSADEVRAPSMVVKPGKDGLALLVGDEAVNPSTLATQSLDSLIPKSAKFVVLFFSTTDCAYCSAFLPKLLEVCDKYLQPELHTAVMMVVNDRSEQAFNEYIGKVQKLPALPWSMTQVKKSMFRSAWGIRTFPHCVLLDRQTGQVVHPNVRFCVEEIWALMRGSEAVSPSAKAPAVLEDQGELSAELSAGKDDGELNSSNVELGRVSEDFRHFTTKFPLAYAASTLSVASVTTFLKTGVDNLDQLPNDSLWRKGVGMRSWTVQSSGQIVIDQPPVEIGGGMDDVKVKGLTLWERFFLCKPVFQMGHTVKPGSNEQFVDEEVVRIRAGLLNCTVWLLTLDHFFNIFPGVNLIYCMFPCVCWDMLIGSFVGLTPFAPYGDLATVIAWVLRHPAKWKPAKPKRFAWWIGVVLSSLCFTCEVKQFLLGLRLVLFMCMCATWLESACGFCLGCFMWYYMVVPLGRRMGRRIENCEGCEA